MPANVSIINEKQNILDMFFAINVEKGSLSVRHTALFLDRTTERTNSCTLGF
ncbi:hypothetical protein HMPREF9136_0187 [Prevotella dentalis DSM 3688]|uniref:Uncharacterized protein n=1 Tax=Prevotella dentalis (strain ATCC 49559 / DSM 3688 / JCM 13448 / NCTC 12043 / ES 2772) TaxID=908937 RepID=F9D010_PREDD|nr:hypothetical protein HMPREF9136_0187 [Prevotella dentalis DSM 3688]